MVNVLRRFSQPLMIIITVLVIVSFTWFYQGSIYANRQRGAALEIYGKTISQDQVERFGRRMRVFYALQNGYYDAFDPNRDFMSRGQKRDPNDNEIINSLVFEHEANALGLGATKEQIQKVILEKTRAFQDEKGNFDPDAFDKFVERVLNPNGYTRGSLEDFAKSAVQVEKMKEILGGTTAPSPGEIRSIYEEYFHTVRASYVKFDLAPHLAGLQVTEEELKARYEERKETMKTDEKRKVRMVSFKIPDAEKELEDKARTEALQPLVNKAEQFLKAAHKTNFEDAAKQLEVPVVDVEEFAQKQPPASLSDNPTAVADAFKLTMESPLSDEIVSKNGATILQLVAITPPQVKPFEEVRAKLETDLKEEKARALMEAQIAVVKAKIEAGIAAGKNFTDAAKEAGVEAKAFPEFSQQEPPKDIVTDSNEIMRAASQLKSGKMSEATRVKDGAVLVFGEVPPPVDEAKYELKRKELVEQIQSTRKEILFRQWLKNRREQAGIVNGEQG